LKKKSKRKKGEDAKKSEKVGKIDKNLLRLKIFSVVMGF